MSRTLPSQFATAAILLTTITASPAVSVFATLNSQDRIVGERQSGSPDLGYYPSITGSLQAGVGGGTNARTNMNTVVGFLLPTLLPGQTIDAAAFSAEIESLGGQALTVSLFGLSTTDPDSSGITLFSESNSGPDLIAASFTSSAAGIGAIPSVSVLAFINSLYTDHVPNQTEVFFRLNPNTDLGTTVRRVNFLNGSPRLELNVIPEPSATLLGGLGALLMLRRRR